MSQPVAAVGDLTGAARLAFADLLLPARRTCLACGRGHRRDAVCRELRDGLWCIVKARTPGPAYRWARAALGLDDEPEAAPVRSAPAGHVHGWAEVDGTWRCAQDFYAAGERPDTGCGATWEPTP